MKTKLEKIIEIGLITSFLIAGSALIASLISEYSHNQRDNKNSPKAGNVVVFNQSGDETSAAGIRVYRKEDGDFEAGYGEKGAGFYYSQDEGIDGGFGL